MLRSLVAAAAFFTLALSQSDDGITLTGTNAATVTGGDYAPNSEATYSSYESTITLDRTSNSYTLISGASSTTSAPQNQTFTTNGTTIVTASPTETLLTASSRNSTETSGTSTSSSARPTNTQPCNGYPEFCTRSYSNITYVAAHNSPFAIRNNALSNQFYGVKIQLNDGIRMLQFQVHKPNATSPLQLCHTSCDLLNAGTLVDYLTEVREWLDENPYEVITILMGNYDYIEPGNFSDPVFNSGIDRYLYTPPTVPMSLGDWPTLGEMILYQERVVMMLDYDTNQELYPWLIDEFGNMWETPFSPTDRDFPCVEDRPPNQDRNTSLDRMYMANHNLNVAVELAGASLLIPASTLLNETNAEEGYGSLGAAADNCTAMWDRPPNFLLVDFYNVGNFNGSVFQVAADANGVTYNTETCCGNGRRVQSIASGLKIDMSFFAIVVGLMLWSIS